MIEINYNDCNNFIDKYLFDGFNFIPLTHIIIDNMEYFFQELIIKINTQIGYVDEFDNKKYNIFGINPIFHNTRGYEDDEYTINDESGIKKGILISEKICYDIDDEDSSLSFKFFITDNIYQVGDCIYMEKNNRVLLKIYNIPKNFHIIHEFTPCEVKEDWLNRIYSYNSSYIVKYIENENPDTNEYLETLDDKKNSKEVLSDLIEYLHIRDGSFLDKFKSNSYEENVIYIFKEINKKKLIIFKNIKDTKSQNDEDNIKQKSSTNIWI